MLHAGEKDEKRGTMGREGEGGDGGVKYAKYLKILSIPERKADIKTESRGGSRRGSEGRCSREGGNAKRGESDRDVETELRDRRGGRRTFQLVIKTCRAVTFAPTPRTDRPPPSALPPRPIPSRYGRGSCSLIPSSSPPPPSCKLINAFLTRSEASVKQEGWLVLYFARQRTGGGRRVREAQERDSRLARPVSGARSSSLCQATAALFRRSNLSLSLLIFKNWIAR